MQEQTLGILMLETRFPRIPGDVGSPETFPFPVQKEMRINGQKVEKDGRNKRISRR